MDCKVAKQATALDRKGAKQATALDRKGAKQATAQEGKLKPVEAEEAGKKVEAEEAPAQGGSGGSKDVNDIMIQSEDHSIHIYSYLSLRKAVGWIGILLPFVMVLGNIVFFGADTVLHNLSVYYHTGMRDIFVGAICAIALFLFFYKGYDRWDNIAADLAGFFALGIAFFPTVKEGPWNWVARVHFYSAACFFVILAFISLFLFTRGEKRPTGRKLKRNVIYRACGVIMLVSLAAIQAYFLFNNANHEDSRFVLIAETVTLMAFGISWLTKGGTLYPDKT